MLCGMPQACWGSVSLSDRPSATYPAIIGSSGIVGSAELVAFQFCMMSRIFSTAFNVSTNFSALKRLAASVKHVTVAGSLFLFSSSSS